MKHYYIKYTERGKQDDEIVEAASVGQAIETLNNCWPLPVEPLEIDEVIAFDSLDDAIAHRYQKSPVEEEKTPSYVDYCKAHAIDELEAMRGQYAEIYGCDLPWELTREINENGSATFSRAKARDFIRAWWNEAGEVYQYQKFNYGEALHNPFEEPEAFHVCMIIEGVNALCSRCATIDEFWNDRITWHDDLIDLVIEEIKAQDTIEF